MAKNSVILSVSIDKEQATFLDDLHLSPSDLIQEKINEQRRIFETVNQEKEKLLLNLKGLSNEIGVLHQFIEEIGQFDNFRKWRGQYVMDKKE